MNYRLSVLFLLLTFSLIVNANGNSTFESFNKAKKALERQVYSQLPNKTLYCGASFKGKKITGRVDGFFRQASQ
jgi:deoxyribonuclease-1